MLSAREARRGDSALSDHLHDPARARDQQVIPMRRSSGSINDETVPATAWKPHRHPGSGFSVAEARLPVTDRPEPSKTDRLFLNTR